MADTATAAPEVDPRRWIKLAVVLTAIFMAMLDISIVNVAVPSIQRNLNATYAQVQLVIAFYALAYASTLITGGRLGDIFGRKRLFILGVTGFTLASALCGYAQSPTMLIAFRVLQGIAAALMYPQALSVIQVVFPPCQRGAAFAILSATTGVATVAGPLLGGLLIQGNLLGLDWRPIFLVNVPVGIGAVIAAAVLLHESKSEYPLRLDAPGVALVTLGLGLVIYPLIQGRDAGWPLWAFLCIAASLPVLGVFLVYERRKTARNDSPLVDMTLFQSRAFVAGMVVGMGLLAGIRSFFVAFSLFVQIGLGYTALQAGATIVPFSLGSMFGSAVSTRLSRRLGRNVLALGASALCAGAILTILTVHATGVDLQGYWLIPALLVGGAGLGFCIGPLLNVVLAGVPVRSAGSASGVYTTVQHVGGGLGIALIGVVLFGLLGAHGDSAGAKVIPEMNRQLGAVGLSEPAIAREDAAFQVCFHDRASAKDPTEVPSSCTPAQRTQLPLGPAAATLGPRTDTILQRAEQAALKENYHYSIQPAFLFDLGAWGLALLLVPFLPRVSTLSTRPTAAAELAA